MASIAEGFIQNKSGNSQNPQLPRLVKKAIPLLPEISVIHIGIWMGQRLVPLEDFSMCSAILRGSIQEVTMELLSCQRANHTVTQQVSLGLL